MIRAIGSEQSNQQLLLKQRLEFVINLEPMLQLIRQWQGTTCISLSFFPDGGAKKCCVPTNHPHERLRSGVKFSID